jgi:hypothetical protein
MRFALAIVSVILVVSLAANGFLCTSLSENNSLKKQNEEMQSQINSLQTQIGELQDKSNTDNNTITVLNGQIASLQKENQNLTALIQSLQNKTFTLNQSSSEGGIAYLVTHLGTKIINTVPIGGPTHQTVLVIGGDVENNGNGTAYNCKIRVVTYELNNPNPFTDYFQLGTGNLTSGEKVNFFANVIHDNIVNWEIFPECTNTH